MLLTDNVKLSGQFKYVFCPGEAPVGQTAFVKALKNNFAHYVLCKFSIELLEHVEFPHVTKIARHIYPICGTLWHFMEWTEGTAVIG